jgi:hypothetical protein
MIENVGIGTSRLVGVADFAFAVGIELTHELPGVGLKGLSPQLGSRKVGKLDRRCGVKSRFRLSAAA